MTTCPFCGCGCGLYLQVEGERVVGVAPSSSHPVSRGRLCVRGWHAHELAASPERLRSPLVRREGKLEEATWDEALGLVADRLGGIRSAGGPSAVGALGSARCTNEENYLLGKVARACLGTNNVDFSARLEALPGLYDLPRYRHLTLSGASLDDIGRADVIVLWQADPAEEHASVAARLLEAVEGGAQLIEVSARSGQLGSLAGIRLCPRPGTEFQLAAGLVHAAVFGSKPSPAGTEALAASVADCTPDWTENATGVPASLVREAGDALMAAARPLVIYTRAATLGPRAGDVLHALSVLDKLKAQRASWSCLLWLSNHNNLQGARDMGVMPYFLTGYQALSEAAVRDKFGRAWGVELPTEPGLSAWDMLGEIRGLLVMGDDPVRVLPDPARARAALGELEFLAVQDIFLSATAQCADVVLPGTSFAEKDGTFTSAERRIQRVRKAAPPPGQARPEWQVLCDLAARLGRPMAYDSPSQVMEEIASLTPLYAGVSYDALDSESGLRWAPPEGAGQEAAAATIGNNFTSAEEGAAEGGDEQFPFVLTPDYAVGSWADEPTVVCSITLRRELGADRRSAGPVVEMNPADARDAGLRAGQRVRVRSRHGEMEASIHPNAAVCRGVLALPYRMREAAAEVMPQSVDPETGVPELAPCAVGVEQV